MDEKLKKNILSQKIGNKANRILKAQRQSKQSVWFGLGMIGLVGWSVIIPTLLGAALGIWIDENHPSSHALTLPLIIVGLIIGCLNAWHWVKKEEKAMQEEDSDE
jgi:ATP synthase protein I